MIDMNDVSVQSIRKQNPDLGNGHRTLTWIATTFMWHIYVQNIEESSNFLGTTNPSWVGMTLEGDWLKPTNISRGLMQEGDVRSNLNISVEIVRKGCTNCRWKWWMWEKGWIDEDCPCGNISLIPSLSSLPNLNHLNHILRKFSLPPLLPQPICEINLVSRQESLKLHKKKQKQIFPPSICPWSQLPFLIYSRDNTAVP